MRVRKCKDCGFPYWLAKILFWNDNGTITSRHQSDYRVLAIESDYLSEIFGRIEEVLGVPIGHIVFEAQRNASRESLDPALNRGRWFIRHVPGVGRLVITFMDRLSLWTGQAYAKNINNESALIRNPFNRDLYAAAVVGALESLRETPFDYCWKKVDGDDVIQVKPISERPEISERLTFTTPPAKPGTRCYERCPRCGVPMLLKDLQWREKEGMITDTRRGVRIVFQEVYTTTVVLRELARELGDDIYPVIIDAMREFSLEHMRKEYLAGEAEGQLDKDRLYREVLDNLALYGQGNPVSYDAAGGKLTVIVENPFSEYVLAGHLSALYELAEGSTPKVTWDFTDPSTAAFELTG